MAKGDAPNPNPGVGSVVHKVIGKNCYPMTVSQVVRAYVKDPESGVETPTGPNNLGEVVLAQTDGRPGGNSQRSEDKHYEGTWHAAGTCTNPNNFVDD